MGGNDGFLYIWKNFEIIKKKIGHLNASILCLCQSPYEKSNIKRFFRFWRFRWYSKSMGDPKHKRKKRFPRYRNNIPLSNIFKNPKNFRRTKCSISKRKYNRRFTKRRYIRIRITR